VRPVPAQAVELARRFEGFERQAYICPAGFWTIGYGHLCEPHHPAITEAEGEAYLAQDLETALRAVLRYCPALTLEDPGKLSAIVDFAFNLGTGRLVASTLRRKINAKSWREAAQELRRWVWGGGRKLPGLILRREAEAILLLG